jgi:hypothetical protein
VAVIDLDLHPPSSLAPIRPPVHRYRHLGLVLAGVLALVLGGAVPSMPAVWRHVGTVPVTAGDALFAPSENRVYTVTVTGDQRVTTAWDVDPVRQLWSVVVRGNVGGGGYLEPLAGGLLLQSEEPETRILDAATGATRWSWPSPVQLLGPRVGMVTESVFAPGTRYDNASGDPGQLYFSPDGQPHTRPPERTELHGVDLATGRRLWTVRERGSVYGMPVLDGSAVLVMSAKGLEVRDGNTGAALRSQALPQVTSQDVWFPETVGDLLLVRRAGTITGYGIDTLTPRWTGPADTTVEQTSVICMDVPCRQTAEAIAVLDPDTGRVAWRAGPEAFLQGLRGGEVVETGTNTGRPVSVRDRTTGTVRTDLRFWDTVETYRRDGHLLLSRFDQERDGTAFGIRQPGATAVRSLGVSHVVVRNCQTSTALVACIGTTGLEVFAYRS